MDNIRNENQNNGSNKDSKKNNQKKMYLIFAVIAVLFIISISSASSFVNSMTNVEVSYDKFLDMLENDELEKVVISYTTDKIKFTAKEQENQLIPISYYTGLLDDENLIPLLTEHEVEYTRKDESSTSATVIIGFLLSYILPLVLFFVIARMITKKMTGGEGGAGIMGVGKSKAKMYLEKQTGVTFKDVAGQEEAKESLQEVVDFLHNPGKYQKIGAKLPKGALLVGPPGTGKTLLAKAVAGEANVPFFSLAGSDFVEMFVGVGASRVRDLFSEAQKNAPCIIFIDEIDAIGRSRDSRYGNNSEHEQTLNQLLSEMDGFDSSKGVFILAATNRPEVLDKALLRPGRFDRRIIVDKPDLKGRIDTLKVHSKNVLMDDTVDFNEIALATSGAVGSDLANIINEAAILAIKRGRSFVNQSDLFESVEVVIAGKEKKDRVLTPNEKKTVAYHEIGHALVTALQKDAEPVQKITIVPRTMGSLGYVMQVPEEEKYLMTKDEIIARLVTLLAGRAAEELTCGSISTGASNDIEQATSLARQMITRFGMSEEFGLVALETTESQYLEGRNVLNCAENTAARVDAEVMRVLKECYDKSKNLLNENLKMLHELAHFLYEKETITGKEFMDIMNSIKENPNGGNE